MALYEYRLAVGDIGKIALLANDNYIVRTFAVQTDQPPYAWQLATDDLIKPYVTRVTALDKSVGGYGKINTKIRFAILTSDMWLYLDTNVFSGNESAIVTLLLRDRLQASTANAQWEAYVGTLIKPPITFEDLHPYEGKAHPDIAFEFVGADIAAGGRSFDLSFDFSWD